MRQLTLPLALACLMSLASTAFPQAECNGWGEFRGIRIHGQLLPFSTSIKLLNPDGTLLAFSAPQTVANPKFSHGGNSQTSSASIHDNSLSYTQSVQDLPPAGVEGAEASARVTIQTNGNRVLPLAGTFYYLTLPADLFAGAKVTYIADLVEQPAPVTLALGEKYPTIKAKGIRISTPIRSIELLFDDPVEVSLKPDKFIDTDYVMQDGLRLPVDPKSLDRFSISFPLATGNMTVGQSRTVSFTLKASLTPDTKPISLALDWQKPGPAFDGIGGNFRMQNPTLDPLHLNYNLENLRVAWGRVEMPLAAWWPQENIDPVAAAANPALLNTAVPPGGTGGRGGRRGPNGTANTAVVQAMTMAKTLADKKIPFMIATWNIPGWAYGPAQRKPDQPAGIQAIRLNSDKLEPVCKAIVSYLLYMKQNYAAEAALFSFNESDLGINVLFTPQEHALLIKTLGPMLLAAGLKTKLLLGDAASPHPVHFIDAAMNDPDCVKHIAAIAFHSWHDGTPEEFAWWGNAAKKLNVPLYCAEGGTDADAYRYPQIFLEPWFAMHELETYLSILRYGQAQSILHWQLTENYSVLTGGGGGTPIQPTRRFFHLKQLSLTPPNTPFIPLTGNAPNLTPVAYGSAAQGTLALHLLNNGTTRELTLTNLPDTINELRAFTTDQSRQMKESPKIPVSSGTAKITLDANAYITLTAGQ